MKIFNKLICGGILAVAVLCGTVNAADSNITNLNPVGGYDTNWTHGQGYRFFNNYTRGVGVEQFSGSTTTNGGNGTFSAGCVNVKHLSGAKDFGLYLSSNGSVTICFYGMFGTETVGAGTAGAALLTSPQAFSVIGATSTTYRINSNPEMVAVGITVTAGTVAVYADMNSLTSR